MKQSTIKTACLFVCLAAYPPLFAQTAPQKPSFDVAMIKPFDPSEKVTYMGFMTKPDGIDARNITVAMLARYAYGDLKLTQDDQITGLPDWAKSKHYNILAKVGETDAAEMQKLDAKERLERMRLMIRSLLEERFKFAAHPTEKEVPDYELIVGKNGPKIKPAGGDPSKMPKDRNGKPISGSMISFGGVDHTMTAKNFTLDSFVDFLGQPNFGLGRVVVNKTGLTGQYDFILHWMPGNFTVSAPGSTGDDSPSVFTAVQEDLGLRLHPSKGTVKVLVIDHVEQPSED